jgi:small subunit ribosomal protein S6
MLLREYETIYILRPDLAEEEEAKVGEKISAVLDREGAKILKHSVWGKKKLAYEINKQPKGVYVSLKYLSEPVTVKEFERNLKIFDPVLKYQTIKISDRVDVEKRLAEQEVENRAEEVIEAKRREERAARVAAEEAAAAARAEEQEKAAAAKSEENKAAEDDSISDSAGNLAGVPQGEEE